MNAERLLGSLLKGSARRSMPGKAAVGMGLLGVAIAAFEHFSEQQRAPVSAGLPPPPTPPKATPPPPPGAAPTGPPPAPRSTADQAVLLIRAMIAAAGADGAVDPEERRRILARVASAGVGQAEREFLERELAAPRPLTEVLGGVTSTELAEQVYVVSLLAVDVDTESERTYLRELARRLALDDAAVSRLHRMLGVSAL
jgi:uncharacterized membrane protein YebE (DUF533 family)